MICTISLSRCSTLRPASLPQTVRNTACCSPSGVTCKISQPLPCCRKSSAGTQECPSKMCTVFVFQALRAHAGPLFQSRRAIQVSQQASCRAGLASECTSAIGLQLWRISGDGSCLFRALAQGHHQLTHTGAHSEQYLIKASCCVKCLPVFQSAPSL